ncbi:BglG family transcription antiterminator [Paenibacillus xerothermodurans]|nr:BglG family transcription antiterminator [Paenibacillus xerothermodurans]
MNASNRTRQILELLLRSDRELTAAEIASELRVSARTVHRELPAVEVLLSTQGIELQKKAGLGIRLAGDEVALETLRRIVATSEDVEFSPDERQLYLLCRLLDNDEPLKLFTLAHDFKVTVSTVSGDLDELTQWLQKFGISLIRRRGYGVQLSGEEADLRDSIRRLIKLRLDDTELITARDEDTMHPLDRQLFELAGKAHMAAVEDVLWRWEEHWTGRLSESAYTDLLIRLSIALARIRAGKTVSADLGLLRGGSETPRTAAEPAAGGARQRIGGDDDSSRDEQPARRLADMLSERLHLNFSAAETGYLARLLSAARANDLSALPGDDLALADTVRALIRKVQSTTGVDYSEDRSLREGLFQHMKEALRRLADGLIIRNPLLDQIKKDYVSLFAAVREAVNRELPDVDVPDEEIGFLVMHFGASLERLKQLRRDVRAILVCTSGIGSSKMLQMRLSKELPRIEIVDRVSWYEAVRIPANNYDLIISTVDLPIDSTQYVKVSPLLTQPETERVRSFIRERVDRSRPAAASTTDKGPAPPAFTSLLSLKTTLDEIVNLIEQFEVVQLRERGGELPVILQEACQHESHRGTLSDATSVTERLLTREQNGSQLLPGTDLALFHARSPEVRRPSLVLYQLAEPVEVGTEPSAQLSQFLLMLAPERLPREILEVLSEVSGMLLDAEMISLLEAGDESAIRNYLTLNLKTFFLNKTESE